MRFIEVRPLPQNFLKMINSLLWLLGEPSIFCLVKFGNLVQQGGLAQSQVFIKIDQTIQKGVNTRKKSTEFILRLEGEGGETSWDLLEYLSTALQLPPQCQLLTYFRDLKFHWAVGGSKNTQKYKPYWQWLPFKKFCGFGLLSISFCFPVNHMPLPLASFRGALFLFILEHNGL